MRIRLCPAERQRTGLSARALSWPGRCPPALTGFQCLSASLPVVGVIAFCLGVDFAHVGAFLRLSVKSVAWAVVHLRVGVHPHLARTSARLGSRGWPGGCSSSRPSRLGRWCGCGWGLSKSAAAEQNGPDQTSAETNSHAAYSRNSKGYRNLGWRLRQSVQVEDIRWTAKWHGSWSRPGRRWRCNWLSRPVGSS